MTTFQFLPLEVGNALLGGVFPPLFHRLIPRIWPRLVKDNEVRSELEKCWTKLAMIQAVLNDAEEKQWTNLAVRIWLDDLRDFAYDLEDMLDEYASKTIEDNLKAEHRTDFVSTRIDQLRAFWNNSNTISSIGDIRKRLEELCERRSQLGLMERVAGETSSAAVWQIPPSTCLLTEPAVYGRDEDKRKILEMMSNDEFNGANFRVISIVGMAGVGKTALAQVVYNDSTGGIHFDRKIWICVSNDFDVFRMSKAILESITHSSCDLKDLNELHVQLKMAVTGRRFLLVLDDVWSKNYDLWKILISPFLTGARGSRIIVTTRSIEVALTIGGPSDYYDLKLLSDDDCWSVFTNHAFENRDTAAHLNSEAFREKVVEKCGGLPLAARTLGGLLRSKLRNNEWEDILNSKIWDLPQESNILPVLKLSYNHLPSYLKRCFAYCAILPKNYEFEEVELVLLWMAEGLILPSSTTTKHLKDIGRDYFHDLFSRSIFQKSSGDASKFVMHNLVNDLAQWVSGETSFRLEEELAAPVKLKRFQRARHSSYSCCNFDGKNKFKVFDEVIDHLRTFLPILTHNLEYCFISNAVIFDLLPKFKKLRVLSLQKYYITKLPDSLGYLRYLRYLNLADTKVRSLPDSIILLFNLQILILRNCSCLLRLPPNVATLINLRHLNISGACLISEMPWGMSELKYLHTLSDFIVGQNSGSYLKDLKNLKFLSGELHISRLQNATNSQELREAILIDKKNLEVLNLDWGLELNSRNERVEKDVLDMLRPHINLRKLTIKHYGGIEFPSWIGNPYFSNMVDLELEDCKNCASLPPLGLLGSLKYLRIKGMTGIRQIGLTFYGEGCSRPFRSLETLCLEDLPIWRRWNPVEDNEHVHSFCRLSELSIINCPELTGTLHRRLPSLQKLVIHQCAELNVSFASIPRLCELDINGCLQGVYTDGADLLFINSMRLSRILLCGNWFRQAFQRLKHLKIKDCLALLPALEESLLSKMSVLEIENCSLLTSFRKVMDHSECLHRLKIEGCPFLHSIASGQLPSSLKMLEISNCNSLLCLIGMDRVQAASTSSQMPENANHINTSLKHLYISDCQSLTTLVSSGQLSQTLEHLYISDCQSLTTLVQRGQLPQTLEHLEIKKCRRLNTFSLDGELPASLERLFIEDCPITFLSSTGLLPTRLQHLKIEFCSRLDILSIGDLPAGLTRLEINSCLNLISIPNGLDNLNSLCEIKICACPRLVSFPQGGLPITIKALSINYCSTFHALPTSMDSLNSLQELQIFECPRITVFPQQGFPTNLTSLKIGGDLHIYAPLVEWGLHRFTSLRKLEIIGCRNESYFPQRGRILPTSLNHLTLANFQDLRHLSPEGFQNLTSLEYFSIFDCPNLRSFPEGLTSSLLSLQIFRCPRLRERCLTNEYERSKIANIPFVKIDDQFIHELEDEDL